jgi:hypothetical protein
MKVSAKDKTASKQEAEKESLQILRHDIANQLSNILLAVEQLRYEIPNATEDCLFYLDSISISSEKINAFLKKSEDPKPGKKA